MRETRLFTYRTPDEVDLSPVVTISVPSATTVPLTRSQRTWAGLVDQVIAWRVDNENTIILEHLLTGVVLRILFSSTLCTRPLFISTGDPHSTKLSLVTACYSGNSGSTLLHLHVSRSLKAATGVPHAVEKSRHFISSAVVNAIQPDVTDSVIALSDGRCARLMLDETFSRPRMSLFVTSAKHHPGSPSVPISSFRSNRLTNWPTQSTNSFVSRFLTPRVSGRPALPGLPSNSGPDSLPTHSGPIDPVVALTVPQGDRRLVASLHASGTVSVHMLQHDVYIFESDCVLPCKLSTSLVPHFLLSGPDGILLAVVFSDEHPKADSLRVYELSTSLVDCTLALSCRQLVHREGPIPPLVAASFFAEDVIVATRTGMVTALINEPHIPCVPAVQEASLTNVTRLIGTTLAEPIEPSSSRGLIGRTLWTVVEDVDEPFGLGRSIDALVMSDRAILLKAHRFSPPVVAKALRLPNSNLANREYILDALSQIQLADNDHDLKRVKTRAEQITKLEDMVVRDINWDSSVGLIISRGRAVHVVRPLLESEKRVYGHHDSLLSCDQLTPRGAIAWLFSSHTICQILAAQFLETKNCDSKSVITSFMLDVATRFSEAHPGKPLTDLICEKKALECANANGNQTFFETIELCRSILQPGNLLLSSLLSLGEWEILGIAAEHCSNELPVSSMFATGIVWLERSKKISIPGAQADVDLNDSQEESEDESSGPQLLKRAYGFFSLAAQSCGKGALRDDLLCALGLAGYRSNQLAETMQVESGLEDEDAWRTWKLSLAEVEPFDNKEGIVLGESAFWLLEHALQLMASNSTPRIAAALALEAMKYAPSKQQHERMRAAAFDRFLEAGELDHALRAVLGRPFSPEGSEITKEEAEALRDSVELFIGAAAEQKKLKWLADRNLPEPLRMLCGQALERRARGTDVVNFGLIAHRHLDEQRSSVERTAEQDIHDGEDSHEYKDVYAWHILREDFENAAYCALEWAERLNDEGHCLLRKTMGILEHDQAVRDLVELYTFLLIEWTDLKREALSCVLSAMRLLQPDNRYVARSRFLVAEVGNRLKHDAVIDVGWVSRRLLLAHAQRLYLVDVLVEQRSGLKRLENVDHLAAEWSPYLTESRCGVEWISSMSRKTLTYDTVSLSAELCCAWREEIGDDALVVLVRDIARGAVRKEVVNFGYSDLDRVLKFIDLKTSETSFPSRNWYVLAVESALMTCAGRASCPQWLVDLAAFGADRVDEEKWDVVPIKGKGDLLGVVRALLRCNRPIESTHLLLRGLEKAKVSVKEGKRFDVSYTAIDATMETLLQLAEDYPEAKKCADTLKDEIHTHIKLVESITDDTRKSIEVADNGYTMESEFDTRDISLVNDNDMEDISVH